DLPELAHSAHVDDVARHRIAIDADDVRRGDLAEVARPDLGTPNGQVRLVGSRSGRACGARASAAGSARVPGCTRRAPGPPAPRGPVSPPPPPRPRLPPPPPPGRGGPGRPAAGAGCSRPRRTRRSRRGGTSRPRAGRRRGRSGCLGGPRRAVVRRTTGESD